MTTHADRLERKSREFADFLNEWLAEHEREIHDGEFCADERGNLLAFLAHRMGHSPEVWPIMVERVRFYEEHHHDHHNGEVR